MAWILFFSNEWSIYLLFFVIQKKNISIYFKSLNIECGLNARSDTGVDPKVNSLLVLANVTNPHVSWIVEVVVDRVATINQWQAPKITDVFFYASATWKENRTRRKNNIWTGIVGGGMINADGLRMEEREWSISFTSSTKQW